VRIAGGGDDAGGHTRSALCRGKRGAPCDTKQLHTVDNDGC